VPSRPEVVPRIDPPSNESLDCCDDAGLVRIAVEGSDQAYEILVRRYTPMVIGFLYARTGNCQDTEDIAQESFFAAYRHLGKLRTADCFGSWLMTIARSKLVDHRRRQSRQPAILETNADDLLADPLDNAPAHSPDPLHLASLSQVKSLVLSEMECMGEKYRSVLYWRLLGEESTAEIAIRLRMRENTVRMRLFRGLKILRKALKKHGITSIP